MTTPSPTGQHRDTSSGRDRGPVGLLARLFLTQLLAVVAVTAVITGAFALSGRGGSAPDVAAGASPTGSPTTAARSPTASRPASPGISTHATPTTPATTTSTTSAPSTPTQQSGGPKVDVLNQSRREGAAGSVAAQLRRQGWTIGRVDNFHGNVARTTVYYPRGSRADARALAHDLPGSPRLRLRFSTLSGSHLSVILVGG